MGITPQTEINLLAGVPLSADYKNTLSFENRSYQYDYFITKTVKQFTNQSYQRHTDGSLIIQCPAEEIYHCNYMMFKNFGHGPKWFYAFVDEVRYVNEITSRVFYTIDVIQTYLLDVEITECFVQREHTNNDAIGANTVPEGLEYGPLVEYDILNFTPHYRDNFYICMVCTFDYRYNDTVPSMRNGVYNALSYNVFETPAAATSFIEGAIENNKFDGIIAAYMVPTYVSINPIPQPITGTIPFKYSAGGYTPKNNKLKIYPYNFLMVITDSDEQTFQWELCKGGAASGLQWSATGYLSPEPVCVWRPTNYNVGVTEQNGLNYRMILDKVPQVAVTADVYKLYLADNAAKFAYGTMAQAAGVFISAIAGQPLVAVAQAGNLLNNIANEMMERSRLENKAPTVKGQQVSSADYACSAKAYRAHYMGLTAEWAKRIDDYFTMFGYATNQVKKPNITGRKAFNYVKTIGADFIGEAPASAIDKLIQIFDSGVTFWHNPQTVGNYHQDNSIKIGG